MVDIMYAGDVVKFVNVSFILSASLAVDTVVYFSGVVVIVTVVGLATGLREAMSGGGDGGGGGAVVVLVVLVLEVAVTLDSLDPSIALSHPKVELDAFMCSASSAQLLVARIT